MLHAFGAKTRFTFPKNNQLLSLMVLLKKGILIPLNLSKVVLMFLGCQQLSYKT